ncbi:hypothetical protein [Thermococcus gorgonarius]|uniref:Uncharacterized protein n=1 Tax=Thermococcus gorgonarius TaxID=71997 RepID=A0A2Z2M600_THEGO|nr:hypothetical protein [Thermococcus gorgonarius]ASJ01690.1 hypothetical protein A3K92_02825 [Thermococcus gorgonarius]
MEVLRVKDIEREVLLRLAKKALKELDEAYLRVPDLDNGKAYLFRGKERVRLMLKILESTNRGDEDAV